MTEPIEMPFGLWILMGSKRHLANTTELSICGGDVACCQNYIDHLLLGRITVLQRRCELLLQTDWSFSLSVGLSVCLTQ